MRSPKRAIILDGVQLTFCAQQSMVVETRAWSALADDLLVLLLQHLVKHGHHPLLEFAVALVANKQVTDAIQPLLAQRFAAVLCGLKRARGD